MFICGWCNKEFEGKYKSRKYKFCSLSCAVSSKNHNNKKGRYINCNNCGESVWVIPSRENKMNHIFCDKKCEFEWKQGKNHPRWNHKKVNCSYCGIEFEQHNYKVEQNIDNFCSRDCQIEWVKENWIGEGHPNWVGGYEPQYGYEWKSLVEQVNDRDRVCQYCGNNNCKLNVHHIIPYRITQDNSLNNLVLLCQSCHPKLEMMYRIPETKSQYFEIINTIKFGGGYYV